MWSVMRVALLTLLCINSTDFRNALRSSLSCRLESRAASRSDSVGTGGRSSIGGPNGANMRVTTNRFARETRQPETISTMSPVRSELLGSCTRCFSGLLKYCAPPEKCQQKDRQYRERPYLFDFAVPNFAANLHLDGVRRQASRHHYSSLCPNMVVSRVLDCWRKGTGDCLGGGREG